MDSVEIVGGILGENFALKFEPPGPEKEVVEIRLEDIQSDDDHLKDCYQSDIKENFQNYWAQDEPILIKQDGVPVVFEGAQIGVNDRTDNRINLDSDSECEIIEIVGENEKSSKNNLIPATTSYDLAFSYQNHCHQKNIVNNGTKYFPKPQLEEIQEQSVANSENLLFSLLNIDSAKQGNIQAIASFRREKPVTGGDLKKKKIKEKTVNSDVGKSKANVRSQDNCCNKKAEDPIAGSEKSLLFSLLTAKKEDFHNLVKNHESSESFTLQSSSSLCLSEAYNKRNIDRSDDVPKHQNTRVNKIQTKPMLYGLLSNQDEQFSKNLRNNKTKRKRQKKSMCNSHQTSEVMLRLSNDSRAKNNYNDMSKKEISNSKKYKKGATTEAQKEIQVRPVIDKSILYHFLLQNNQITNCIEKQGENLQRQQNNMTVPLAQVFVLSSDDETLDNASTSTKEPNSFLQSTETSINNGLLDQENKHKQQKNSIENKGGHKSAKELLEYRMNTLEERLFGLFMKNPLTEAGQTKQSINQKKDPRQKQLIYNKRKKQNDIRKVENCVVLSSSEDDDDELRRGKRRKPINSSRLSLKTQEESENCKVVNNKDIYRKSDYKNIFLQSKSKGKQEQELIGQSKKEYGKNKQPEKGENTDEDPFNCSSDDDLDLNLTKKTLQIEAQPTGRNITVSSTADNNFLVFEVDKLSNDSHKANRKQGTNYIEESKEGEEGKSKEVSEKVVACARQDIIVISNTSDNIKGESWPEKSSETTSKEKVVESTLVINSSDNNHKKSCDDSNQETSWPNESSNDDQGAYRLQKKNSVENGKGEKNKGVSEKMAASARQNDTDTNNTNDVKYDEDKRKEGKEGEGKELELPEKLVASAMQAVIDNSTVDNDNHNECLRDALNNDYQESNKIQEEEKEVSIVKEPATHLSNGNSIADNNIHNKSLPDESSNRDQQNNEISKKDSVENEKEAEDKKNKAVSEKSEKISASAKQNVIDNSSTNNVNYNEDKGKKGTGDEQKLEELPENIVASAVQVIIDDSCNDDDNHDKSWPDASDNDYQEGNQTQEKIFGKDFKKEKEISKVGEPLRKYLTDVVESSNDDQQTNKINKNDSVGNIKKSEDRENKEVSEKITACDFIAHSDANDDNHDDESRPDKLINEVSNEIHMKPFIENSKRGEKRKLEMLKKTENIAAYAREAVINSNDSDDNDQDYFVPDELSTDNENAINIQQNDRAENDKTEEKRKLVTMASETEKCKGKETREQNLFSENTQKESETNNKNQGVKKILKTDFTVENSKRGEKRKLNESSITTKKVAGLEALISKSVYITRPKPKRKRSKGSCPYCSRVFHNSYLPRHIILEHTDEKNIDYLRCDKCEYKTTRKQHLQRHILMKHTEPENMMEDMKKCDQCPKMYKLKKSLVRHKEIIHTKKEKIVFQCVNCDFKTGVKRTLQHHMEDHLYPDKIYSCPDCHFTTKSKIMADRHKYNGHPRQMFQCHVCAYKTKYLYHLKNHLISHKEVKDDKDLTLRCDKCDYKTHRHYSLKIHMLKHQRPEEMEMFHCYHCNFKANRKDNLKTHIFKHEFYKDILDCFICSFKTSVPYELKKHLDTHSENQRKEAEKLRKLGTTERKADKSKDGNKNGNKGKRKPFKNNENQIDTSENIVIKIKSLAKNDQMEGDLDLIDNRANKNKKQIKIKNEEIIKYFKAEL